MDDTTLHIVVFPWFAMGHLMPFLELSKSLAKKGHHISFISTPRNILTLPKVPSHIAPLIDFVSFPLPQSDDLHENAEATMDLQPDEVQYLKKALDGLEGPITKFLQETSPKPDWIILDFAQYWLPRIGAELSIPCAFFCVFRAAVLAFSGPPTDAAVTEPTAAISLREAQDGKDAHSINASGVSDMSRLTWTIQGCKVMAPRSCMELESNCLSLLPELYKMPVIPVGLLPPLQVEDKKDHDATPNKMEIFEWLDKQIEGSVVYVALGSEAPLSIELVHELALGLELSKVPFLWALRKPAGGSEDVAILPEGFEERTRSYGVVSIGWVPQVRVLAHASVGGFLTHCGWNSIIEGLWFGHPFIMLPIFLDQGFNARMMREKKVGIEVHRNEDGDFTREAVATALRLVMVEEEGELFRAEAKQMRELIGDKECNKRYVDGFVQFLIEHRNRQD